MSLSPLMQWEPLTLKDCNGIYQGLLKRPDATWVSFLLMSSLWQNTSESRSRPRLTILPCIPALISCTFCTVYKPRHLQTDIAVRRIVRFGKISTRIGREVTCPQMASSNPSFILFT